MTGFLARFVSHLMLFRVQSLARMNKKDSWLFWWTIYLTVSNLLEMKLLFVNIEIKFTVEDHSISQF